MKKQTGGGTFDSTEQPLYFVASNASNTRVPAEMGHPVLIAVNELETPKSIEELERILDTGAKVFLDSGIFNLTNRHARAHDVPMDEALALAPDEIDGFDELWDRYATLVQRYHERLWGFIELDQGGAVNKRVTRARIEKQIGVTPIPVYHPLNDGWDYFDEIAGDYDRICFGNIVQANQFVRKRLLQTAFERQRNEHPETWIHLLGFTPNEWIHSAPWYGSCDSSSWLVNLRWAAAHKSHGGCKRIGTFTYGARYKYGDDESFAKANQLAAAQGGVFLERTWAAYLDAKKEIFR